MGQISEQVRQTLRAHGAVLKRQGVHYVFVLPNGQNIIVSRSSSDKRADRNIISTIRRLSRRAA